MRRWLVLAVFGFNTALNAVASMNFSPMTSVSAQLLSTDIAGVDWLYSGMLLSVLPATIPAAYGLVHAPFFTSICGIVFNALAAWLRFAAMASGSFTLALLSSVSLGFAAAVIICSYTSLAERNFPPKERSMATSIAVQCNYIGWALGSLIPLIVRPCDVNEVTGVCDAAPLADTGERYKNALLVQAIAMTLALPLFVLTSSPKDGATEVAHADVAADGERGSPLLLARNGQFWLHTLCYSLLGGVSFTIPGIQDSIFSGCLSSPKWNSSQTMWTDFSFITCGVVTGLVVGYKAKDPRHHHVVLRVLFGLTALSLTAIAIFATPSVAAFMHDHAPNSLYSILIVLMGVAGAGSLGFIGLGLHSAASLAQPVSEAYSGGLVEWLVQAWGALLTQISDCNLSFWGCTGVAWVVLFLFCAIARHPHAALPSEHSEALLR